MTERQEAFESWVILELVGHRRLGGYLREQTVAGAAFLRIDVPGPEGETMASQFYAPGSVYCITPTTEELARAVATRNQPAPVQRWELPPAVDVPTQSSRWDVERDEFVDENGDSIDPDDQPFE